MRAVRGVLLGIVSAIDRLTIAVGSTVRWLTLVLPLVCFGYAMARKLLPWGHNGFSELQWYLFAVIYLLAAGYTLLRDEHVRVDFFWRGFGWRTRCRIDLACLLPLCAVCAWLAGMYWDFWLVSVRQRDGPEDVLTGLERWPVKLALFVGFTLLALQAAGEALKRIAALLQWIAPASVGAGSAAPSGKAP
jgi:TRAP-type mannitol/chloroaromatic compound transport system permease small subunit